jgi:hypothetical protein
MFQALGTYLLGAMDKYPTALTDQAAVAALIQRLRPVSQQRELLRMGPAGDGGYLVPDDLNDITACFSPGVAESSGFEREWADAGTPVFLADRSVSGPPFDHPNFHFTQKYVGAINSGDYMSLNAWVNGSLDDPASDLCLQMDIEGAEYEVLLNVSEEVLSRFRIIVAEFHAMHMLWSRPFFMLASRAFDRVLQTHRVVHVHPNNTLGAVRKNGLEIPRLMEFTFLRDDRVYHSDQPLSLPHPLDVDNTNQRSLPLPACWKPQ